MTPLADAASIQRAWSALNEICLRLPSDSKIMSSAANTGSSCSVDGEVCMLGFVGESFNPGECGEVTVGGGERPKREKAIVVIRLIVALALLGGWVWLLANPFGVSSLKWWAISGGLTIMYVVVAWHVRPEPDMDNIGWGGGLIDHPFRWSDDFNRTLLWLRILLWPGLFLAESLLDAPVLFQSKPVRSRRRRRRVKPVQPGGVFHASNDH